MSAFVTESVSDSVEVAVFTQSEELFAAFSSVMGSHRINLHKFSSDLSSLEKFRTDGQSKIWYKLIWLDDVKHLSLEKTRLITQIFKQQKGLTYLITHQPFSYTGDSKLEKIGTLLTDISTFLYQRSPYTSILTYRDVVADHVFSLNLAELSHYLPKGKLALAYKELAPLDLEEALSIIGPLIFDPRGGKRKVAIGKKKYSFRQIAREITDQLKKQTEARIRLEVLEHSTVDFATDFQIVEGSSSLDLSDVVQEVRLSNLTPDLDQMMEERSVSEARSKLPRPKLPPPPSPTKKSLEQINTVDRGEESTPDKSKTEEKTTNPPKPEIEKPKPEVKPQPEKSATQVKAEENAKQVLRNNETTKIEIPEQKTPKIEVTVNQVKPHIPNRPPRMTAFGLIPQINSASAITKSEKSPLAIRTPGQIAIPNADPPEIMRSKAVLKNLLARHQPRPIDDKTHRLLTAKFPNQPTTHRSAPQAELDSDKDDVKPELKQAVEKKIAALFGESVPSPDNSLSSEFKKKSSTIGLNNLPNLKALPSLTDNFKQLSSGKDSIFTRQSGNNSKPTSIKSLVLLFVGSGVAVAASLILFFFLSVARLQAQIANTYQQIVDQKPDLTTQISGLKRWSSIVKPQLVLYQVIIPETELKILSAHVQRANGLAEILSKLETVQTQQIEVLKASLTASETDSGSVLTPLAQSPQVIDDIYSELSTLEADLKNQPQDYQWLNLSDPTRDKLPTSLNELRKKLLIHKQVIQVFLNLFEDDQTKTFAVLIQDAQELRPTGGFVQGVMILRFKNGRLVDSQLLTTDQIDSQIETSLEPPVEITQYLGENQWYSRDMNWAGGFDQAANHVVWFIEKGLGTPLDGVIGINTLTIQEIIRELGQVKIAAVSNEALTAGNFQERALFAARDSVTEAKSDEPEFLSATTQELLSQLPELSDNELADVMRAVSTQLKQSEATIWLKDEGLYSMIKSLGWGGEVMSPVCPTQLAGTSCRVSRIYQVEANIGVNKTNYLVKKKIVHQTQIKDNLFAPDETQLQSASGSASQSRAVSDSIIHKRTITYENQSTSSSWPAGPYQAYVRWYVDNDVRLRSVLVNNRKLAADEISLSQEKGSLVIGARIDVPPQTSTTVVIEYDEPPISPGGTFALFDQKQPGTFHTPTNFEFFYDAEMVPTVIAPDGEVGDSQINFQFYGEENRFAGVKFR